MLLIPRPTEGSRLNWPSWLIHSGRLAHKVVTRQPWIRRRSGKVRQLQTDVLTTEPRRQHGRGVLKGGPGGQSPTQNFGLVGHYAFGPSNNWLIVKLVKK